MGGAGGGRVGTWSGEARGGHVKAGDDDTGANGEVDGGEYKSWNGGTVKYLGAGREDETGQKGRWARQPLDRVLCRDRSSTHVFVGTGLRACSGAGGPAWTESGVVWRSGDQMTALIPGAQLCDRRSYHAWVRPLRVERLGECEQRVRHIVGPGHPDGIAGSEPVFRALPALFRLLKQ